MNKFAINFSNVRTAGNQYRADNQVIPQLTDQERMSDPLRAAEQTTPYFASANSVQNGIPYMLGSGANGFASWMNGNLGMAAKPLMGAGIGALAGYFGDKLNIPWLNAGTGAMLGGVLGVGAEGYNQYNKGQLGVNLAKNMSANHNMGASIIEAAAPQIPEDLQHPRFKHASAQDSFFLKSMILNKITQASNMDFPQKNTMMAAVSKLAPNDLQQLGNIMSSVAGFMVGTTLMRFFNNKGLMPLLGGVAGSMLFGAMGQGDTNGVGENTTPNKDIFGQSMSF